MRQNPCRYCILSEEYKGVHYRGGDKKCETCEKYFAHREYLKSKRKFTEGEPINSIEELLKEEWVMWYGQTKHIEMFKSMPLRSVLRFLELGAIRKAVRKEREDD